MTAITTNRFSLWNSLLQDVFKTQSFTKGKEKNNHLYGSEEYLDMDRIVNDIGYIWLMLQSLRQCLNLRDIEKM